MKKLHFAYSMLIQYAQDVTRCNFTIKCIPEDSLRQKIENKKISLLPPTTYCVGKDGFNNTQIYGVNEAAHSCFSFMIEGDATTGLSPYEEDEDDNISMVFKHPFGLNKAGAKIREYYENVRLKDVHSDIDTAIYLMHRLHEDFKYTPGTTDVNTSAEDAFAQGHGVCQDYAHIYIALMHLCGIPARYVTGLIIGEGQSHAWVEVLVDGKWYGLDPTNDVEAGDDHIKIGVGRDAKDCMINRGIMHGGGPQLQSIQVSVVEI